MAEWFVQRGQTKRTAEDAEESDRGGTLNRPKSVDSNERYVRGMVLDHEHVRASWERFSGAVIDGLRIQVLKPPERHSAVYRLHAPGVERPVVAKQTLLETIHREARVYRELLCALPFRSPRLLGAVEDPGARTGWLFLEDMGDAAPDFARRGDRLLTARWLGRFHKLALTIGPGLHLAERGSDYYLHQLQVARDNLQHGLFHPRVGAASRRLLRTMIQQLDELESGWHLLERASSYAPATIVHGDFVAKNLRLVGNTAGGVDLVAVDWETCGMGSPAPDLEAVDLAAYAQAAGISGAAMDELRDCAIAGRAFRLVISVRWASAALKTHWPDRALEGKLPAYERSLHATLHLIGSA